jgi:hypothetical protein
MGFNSFIGDWKSFDYVHLKFPVSVSISGYSGSKEITVCCKILKFLP